MNKGAVILLIICKQKNIVTDNWDEKNQCFVVFEPFSIWLEHSLWAISKWEEIYKKPFTTTSEKGLTDDELLTYVKYMDINTQKEETTDMSFYRMVLACSKNDIINYIEENRTAIKPEKTGKPSSKIVTSELVYCWMASYRIPYECDKWNFTKLMALLEVCSVESQPEKKMSRSEVAAFHRQRNEEMRARYSNNQ